MLIKVDGVFMAGIGLRTPTPEIPEAVYVVDSVFGRFGLDDQFVIEVRVLDGARARAHNDFTRVSVRELVELLRGPIRSR
jgi:hypothetical protein